MQLSTILKVSFQKELANRDRLLTDYQLSPASINLLTGERRRF